MWKRFYMVLTPQLEKAKTWEMELDVKKPGKDGICWHEQKKCLQGGARVSWFPLLSHAIAMHYFTGAACAHDKQILIWLQHVFLRNLTHWAAKCEQQQRVHSPRWLSSFFLSLMNIFFDDAMIITILDAAIIGFKRHLTILPVSSTNAVPVSGSRCIAERSFWNTALESNIDVWSKILREDLHLFSMQQKLSAHSVGNKLAALARFHFCFLFDWECVSVQCLPSSEPHLLFLAATAGFCLTNQVRHLKAQRASALSPLHYGWPPLTGDHPMTQRNESSDGKRLNRRRKYRLKLNKDLTRTVWAAFPQLVCQRGSAMSRSSGAQTHLRRQVG